MRGNRFVRVRGMTLIEVMVAIAIFALLGVISWRAVSSMADARERMDAEFSRWRAIARVGQQLENDLSQLAPRLGLSTQSALSVVRDTNQEELILTRFDPISGGVQNRVYRLDKDALILVRLPKRSDTTEFRQDVLLKSVKSLHWRFLVKGQQVTEWTPSPQSPWQLPEGVIMELELADAGTITRIFALR